MKFENKIFGKKIIIVLDVGMRNIKRNFYFLFIYHKNLVFFRN